MTQFNANENKYWKVSELNRNLMRIYQRGLSLLYEFEQVKSVHTTIRQNAHIYIELNVHKPLASQ